MGVEVSWEEAYRRSLRWARRYARNAQDAEDVAQEALLRAWRHRAKLRDPGRFPGWLAAIVRNEAIRGSSRVSLEPASATDADVAIEDERLAQAATRADLARGLCQLSAREQMLLRLRYEEDLSQVQIARGLGVPEGTVKVQLHRARGKLLRALGEP